MIEPVVLPSGAELRITLAPFAASKALYQAVLDEVKHLKIEGQTEIDFNLMKDLFCIGFSSQKIELALAECMKRCLYNGLKIDKDTFESPDARQDYFTVCFEVGKANIEPFMKALMPKLQQFSQMTSKDRA